MAKKDPEAARMAVEQERAEIKKLIAEIKQYLDKVPARVINGSHNEAVAFKNAAVRGLKITETGRPTLHAVRQCASELARFYT